MPSWIEHYPYLFASLLGLPPVLLGYAIAGEQRRMMLVCGLSFAVFSPLSILHQGAYWAPNRVGGGSWGIEDILICASIGGLVRLAALPIGRLPLVVHANLKISACQLSAFGVFSVGMIITLERIGLGIMGATILVQIILIVGVLALRLDLWPMAVRAGILYLPYYILVLTIAGLLNGNFYAMWDGTEIWGMRLLKLPIEEFFWAGTLGFLPLVFAYALEAHHAAPKPKKSISGINS